MARITSVDVTAGVPTAGTGTVATLDGVFDATNGPVTTKAASTAPVTATDKALVTVLRPDSPGIIATVAHDAVDAGDPLKTGGRAVAGMSGLTLVAASDRTDSLHGLDGAQYVRPHCGLEDIVTNVATCTTGANTSGIAAQGAGLKFYLTDVLVSPPAGSTTAGNVSLTDGSGGTEKVNVPFSPNGAVKAFTNPVPFSANTAVFADPTGSETIKVTLVGFKSKV